MFFKIIGGIGNKIYDICKFIVVFNILCEKTVFIVDVLMMSIFWGDFELVIFLIVI